MKRQERICWLERPERKRRAVLFLTCDETLPVLFDALVAPVTTRACDRC